MVQGLKWILRTNVPRGTTLARGVGSWHLPIVCTHNTTATTSISLTHTRYSMAMPTVSPLSLLCWPALKPYRYLAHDCTAARPRRTARSRCSLGGVSRQPSAWSRNVALAPPPPADEPKAGLSSRATATSRASRRPQCSQYVSTRSLPSPVAVAPASVVVSLRSQRQWHEAHAWYLVDASRTRQRACHGRAEGGGGASRVEA